METRHQLSGGLSSGKNYVQKPSSIYQRSKLLEKFSEKILFGNILTFRSSTPLQILWSTCWLVKTSEFNLSKYFVWIWWRRSGGLWWPDFICWLLKPGEYWSMISQDYAFRKLLTFEGREWLETIPFMEKILVITKPIKLLLKWKCNVNNIC